MEYDLWHFDEINNQVIIIYFIWGHRGHLELQYDTKQVVFNQSEHICMTHIVTPTPKSRPQVKLQVITKSHLEYIVTQYIYW